MSSDEDNNLTISELTEAIAKQDAPAVADYLQKKADPNQKVGVLPLLHFAVIFGNAKIVELLLRAGADINACDDVGQSALHQAGVSQAPDVADMIVKLIAAGLEVNRKDSRGRTPLDNAAGAYNSRVARQLLGMGGTCKSQYAKWLKREVDSDAGDKGRKR